VSLDKKPEDIVKFRNNKWKMPWFNSFLSENVQKMISDFDVIAIPYPI
jgi:hypothetical protein